MSAERNLGIRIDQTASHHTEPLIPQDLTPARTLARELGISNKVMSRLMKEGTAGGFNIWTTEQDRRQKLLSRQEFIDYIAPHPKTPSFE